MSQFDDFIAAVKDEVANLSREHLTEFVGEAIEDGESFLQDLGDDLPVWTDLLTKGELTLDEFEFLVKSRLDVTELTALKNAGLAKVRLEKFQNDVLGVIVKNAKRFFV